MSTCGHVYVSGGNHGAGRHARAPGAAVTAFCEVPDIPVVNRAQVLCKKGKYFQLLRFLSILDLVSFLLCRSFDLELGLLCPCLPHPIPKPMIPSPLPHLLSTDKMTYLYFTIGKLWVHFLTQKHNRALWYVFWGSSQGSPSTASCLSECSDANAHQAGRMKPSLELWWSSAPSSQRCLGRRRG